MHRLKRVDARVAAELNRAAVFDLLRTRRLVSRTGLARETGLSKATMSQIIEQFIQDGLVEVAGPGPSSLGRRPTLLRLNPRARVAIGVELGDTSCTASLTDLYATPVRTIAGATRAASGAEALASVIALVAELSAELPPGKLVGIGVGTPGLVDSQRGVIHFAPDLGWRDVSVGPALAERFAVPVAVINRAKAAAVGEAWCGAGEGIDSFVYVSISTGISAGIVIGQTLYRGVSPSEGELGHVTILPDPDAPLCACGNRGCLQTVAAGPAILARVRERLRTSGHVSWDGSASGQLESLTIETVASMASEGNPIVNEVLAETGRYLGIAAANLVDLLNPRLLIFGGSVVRAMPVLLPLIEAEIRRRALSVPAAAVGVVPSRLGRQAVSVGAAAFLLSQISVVGSSSAHHDVPPRLAGQGAAVYRRGAS